ncbi:MAG TPA: Lrp/AsnC family transcriptional regulator [Desulfurococcales archaeon]|nr:Lrp/AsnC family transcriptional regulator [Desulfurococcales archaeon]
MSTSYHLDETDKRILRLLQEDAKIPYSRLAKILNVSEATIHLRIKKLKQLGILRGFHADIDPAKVGKGTLAFVLIKAQPKLYDHVLSKLSKLKDVYELYDVTGEFYALAKVRVSDREDLARLLDEIGRIDGVESTYTMYVLRVIKEKKTVNID